MDNKRKECIDQIKDHYKVEYNDYNINKKIKLYDEKENIEESLQQICEYNSIIINLIHQINEKQYIITNLIEENKQQSILLKILENKILTNNDKYNLYT